jgi:hypothetical protein
MMLVYYRNWRINIYCVFLILSYGIEFFSLNFTEALAEEASVCACICDSGICLRYLGFVHEDLKHVVHIILREVCVLCDGGDCPQEHACLWGRGRSHSDVADC